MFRPETHGDTEDAPATGASFVVSALAHPCDGPGLAARLSGRVLAGLTTLAALTEPAQSRSGLDAGAPALIGAQFVPDEGAASRLHYAGELRMLSQRVATTACAYQAGIAPETSQLMLREATAAFDRIIDGLLYGDEGLGMIGPETSRRVKADIEAVHDIWDPMHLHIDAILDQGPDPDGVMAIVDASIPLLKITGHMVSVVSGEYSDPAVLLQADAVLMDFVGRQEMIPQEMSKDVCQIAQGIHVDKARAELQEVLPIYDATLQALRTGMPAAGIAAPPTPDIAAGLETLAGDWAQVKTRLVAIAEGAPVSTQDQVLLFAALNELTDRMVGLAKLYAIESDLGL